MSFEHHVTFSATDRIKPYEFDLYLDSKKEGFQVKLGENYYSIRSKNTEDLGAIKEILQKSIGEKILNSIDDLTHNVSLLSSVKDIQTNNIYHVGIRTLSGSSPISNWCKQETQLKHNVGELYWKKKVIGEHHIILSTQDREKPYEFDLYLDDKKEGFQVKLGENYYSIKLKNPEDLTLITEILQKGIGETELNSIESLNNKVGLISAVKDIKTDKLYPHEGFTGFLSFIAKYDNTVDNRDDTLINDLRDAIKTGNKEKFIKIFESLPQGMVGSVNHGEGLNGIPEPIKRNPEKKVFTESDLVQLQQYIKETKFSGVICLSDANGIHTLSSNEILKSNTPFAMHSIGKMFTGMLAIKMIEMGIIPTNSLDNALDKPIQLDPKVMDKLEEYCPAVKEHLTKKGAPTFRQIMLHEGGLDDYLNKYEAAIQEAIDTNGTIPRIDSPEDFLKYAQEEIHELKKGETHYSNLGLLLTGLSIQHHYNLKNPSENKTYQEILEEFVLKPAGISSFTLTRPEDGSYNERHAAAAHIQGGPAGGYWITPIDLLKFGQWTAKQCEDKSFYGLVKEYGGEFQPERQQIKKEEDLNQEKPSHDSQKEKDFNPEELSHGGQIDSATSFLGTFLPNGISIAILSNQPFHAAVLEGAIKDHVLSEKY